MRSTLQYFYTVSVFLGVILTMYFMLSQDGGSRFPLRALQIPEEFRSEATFDPAINQLMQIEKELARLPRERAIIERRIPSEIQPEERKTIPPFEK